jgi:enoyl-CoA hydratase
LCMQRRYEAVSFEKNDRVAVITVAAFTEDLLRSARLSDEIGELCSEIEADEGIRAVVVADSPETSLLRQEEPGKIDGEQPLSRPALSESIAGLDRPTIAAINRDAIGLGLELAMACDIRVVTQTSRVGLPHILGGIIPSDGGTQRLPRLVGKAKALEMILTGELIDAGEAYRIGLVQRVVSPNEATRAALALAQEMTSKAPVALRFLREALYKGMDLTLEQGLRMEGDLYLLLYSTTDRTEGIEAFKQRRRPTFLGK